MLSIAILLATLSAFVKAEIISPVEMGFLWTAPTEKSLANDFILMKEGLYMTIQQYPFSRAKEACEASGLVLAEWKNPLSVGLWTSLSPAYFSDPEELAKPRRVICAKLGGLLKDAAELPVPLDDFIQLEPKTFLSKVKVSLNAAEIFCQLHGMSLGSWNNPLAPLLWTAASLSITDANERANHKQVICVVDVTKKEFILKVSNAVFIDVKEETK